MGTTVNTLLAYLVRVRSGAVALVLTLAGLSAGAMIAVEGSAAHAATPHARVPRDTQQASPEGGDTYQVIEKGLVFDCSGTGRSETDPVTPCSIKARVSLSRGAVRYLGLKSATLVSGTPKGPIKDVMGPDPDDYTYQYVFKFPASLERVFKAKHVVAASLSVTGSATYGDTYDDPDNPNSTPTFGDYTQKLNSTGANQVALGQGPRYGCFAIGQGPLAGGGDLIIGYWHYGQKCPKYPG